MTTLFIILIILASVVLGFIVLVQNPKGGGLAGNVAGLSNQFMGVKQTTDVLEKGTWIFGGVIALLCLLSVFFIPGTATSAASNSGATGAQAPAGAQKAPVNAFPVVPAPGQTPPNK
ncbi:MAG TPA: preprotein translocase subunit SecG [Chitinophagaceae bacterium]|jgi:preprotein translocase subunit SecG|nr:preprotein translocase subunit SecG [Chitinophagaceae bacterium]